MNKNNLLLKNPIIIQFYRFIKVLFYKFFYGTSFYKLKYSANTKNFLDSNTKYLLVTCHNGGGGTVTYLKNKYKNKSHVIILRNAKTADKDYLYSLENADSKRIIFIKPKDIKFLENSLNAIHVLSLESYMSLNFLLKWFASLSLPITYDLHDFHCIWYEAHFIHNEKYLLEDEVKKSVLHYAFKKITFEDLHSVWNNFFPYVHKINAFSQSSKEIFSHYFPDL